MITRLVRAGFNALCAFLEEVLRGPVDTGVQAIEVAQDFYDELEAEAEQREYHKIRCEEVAEAAAERWWDEIDDFQAWELEYVDREVER